MISALDQLRDGRPRIILMGEHLDIGAPDVAHGEMEELDVVGRAVATAAQLGGKIHAWREAAGTGAVAMPGYPFACEGPGIADEAETNRGAAVAVERGAVEALQGSKVQVAAVIAA